MYKSLLLANLHGVIPYAAFSSFANLSLLFLFLFSPFFMDSLNPYLRAVVDHPLLNNMSDITNPLEEIPSI